MQERARAAGLLQIDVVGHESQRPIGQTAVICVAVPARKRRFRIREASLARPSASAVDFLALLTPRGRR
jgi:hypothetical protein